MVRFTIIYLKMLLLSLKDEGKLYFEDLKDSLQGVFLFKKFFLCMKASSENMFYSFFTILSGVSASCPAAMLSKQLFRLLSKRSAIGVNT